MGKYDLLGSHLGGVDPVTVWLRLTFEEVDLVVGGMPPSARTQRSWWANNSSGHALVWRAAGWHVQAVDLGAGLVVFARGRVGGGHVERRSVGGRLAGPASGSVAALTRVRKVTLAPDERAEATVAVTWTRIGEVVLDDSGHVSCPGPLPGRPGLYRFTLTGRGSRPQLMLGVTDNLGRELAADRGQRSAQPRHREEAVVRHHLDEGGRALLDVSLRATVNIASRPGQNVDLTRKAGRLLAKDIAVVLARLQRASDLVDLG